jgi:hypothetical protein
VYHRGRKNFLLLPNDRYIDHLADHVHRRAYILSSTSIKHAPFTHGVAPRKDPMRGSELLHMFDERDENRVEHRLLQRRAIVGELQEHDVVETDLLNLSLPRTTIRSDRLYEI